MNVPRISILLAALFCASQAWSQTYTNFIRQIQYPTGVVWDAAVAASGERMASLPIDPGGARFELWTVSSIGPTSFLLGSNYVGSYTPVANVTIRSEDLAAAVPRTRADRPFYVDVVVSGMRSGATDPEAAKKVKFLRHVQSYGVGGNGVGIDRAQATLLSQSFIQNNGTQNLTFLINSVPGADRSKVRGEERFSIFSLADYQVPEMQIDSKYIQIWPVADASISGIQAGQVVRYSLPQLTLTLNDLYPSSTTYVQVYKGNSVLGTKGTIIQGSALTVSDASPMNRILTLKDYDEAFDADGRWTMEILTVTPFGTDRLAQVTFDLDRTMKMNGSFTSIE